MGIYVSICIHGLLDELWERTQDPALHQRWDLRFSAIDYLSRPDLEQPQQFRYETRLGFGLSIQGEGETVGTREGASGKRTSALKFWSDDPKSLIREGAGYWQYLPGEDGVIFLTRYDYQTRFGWLGRQFDRWVFRPLMAWATAWSFDRLRLWLEHGIEPETSLRNSLLHHAVRAKIALVGLWLIRRFVYPRSQLMTVLLTLLLGLLTVAYPVPANVPAARRSFWEAR